MSVHAFACKYKMFTITTTKVWYKIRQTPNSSDLVELMSLYNWKSIVIPDHFEMIIQDHAAQYLFTGMGNFVISIVLLYNFTFHQRDLK